MPHRPQRNPFNIDLPDKVLVYVDQLIELRIEGLSELMERFANEPIFTGEFGTWTKLNALDQWLQTASSSSVAHLEERAVFFPAILYKLEDAVLEAQQIEYKRHWTPMSKLSEPVIQVLYEADLHADALASNADWGDNALLFEHPGRIFTEGYEYMLTAEDLTFWREDAVWVILHESSDGHVALEIGSLSQTDERQRARELPFLRAQMAERWLGVVEDLEGEEEEDEETED